MEDLPGTQTQEDYIESSQEPEIDIIKPWGRLCGFLKTLASVGKYIFKLIAFGFYCLVYIEVHISRSGTNNIKKWKD